MSKKVIVVDDSATVRQQLSNVLTSNGYQVIEAVDGLDGLDQISKTPDAAIILCDVNMPRMSGLDMIESLKQRKMQIPVIMLTTEGEPRLVERAKKAGAKGWIVKPFKIEQLLVAIKNFTK